MMRFTTFVAAVSSFVALALPVAFPIAFAADAGDTILVRRGDVVITRADWDAELLRIPAKDRADFAENPRRNRQLLERMLTTREMAAMARAKKLDQDPMLRIRVRQEEDRLLAAMLTASVEEGAALDFEMKLPSWTRRAREIYEVDKAKYSSPETVSVTMIFFGAQKDGFDGAQKRAGDALAQIRNGADIGALAASLSDDPTTRGVSGRKGPLAHSDLDPNLANNVFALKRGEITGVLRTRDGWFIMRLDERHAPVPRSFDQVKGEILAELKQSQVNGVKDAFLASVGEGKDLTADQSAIEALRTPPK